MSAETAAQGRPDGLPTDAPLAVPEAVLARTVGDELVLLHTGSELYFGLDPIGTAMWEALRDSGTVAAAHAVLAPQYDVDADTLLRDLHRLAAALVEKGLLTVDG